MNEEAIKAQQIVADNFYKIGLLPQKVDVKSAVLTPEQYAALVPPTDVTVPTKSQPKTVTAR